MSDTETEAQERLTQAQDAPKPGTPKATEYVILEKYDGADRVGFEKAWTDAGRQKARSSKAAVTAHVNEKGLEDGTFVAVPARSWEPITVKTETTTKLAFS